MIRLAEHPWPVAARLARDPRSVVLLPLGAVEQHGPHLPLLVDWLGAEELARRIAPHLRRAGWRPILVPGLPYGASPLARGFAGTISLSARTLTAVASEILEALVAQGFRRFVLANYQADPAHLEAMARIKRRVERRRAVRVLFAGFAPATQVQRAMTNARVTRLLRSPRPDREWHSGEMETSLVLACPAAPRARSPRAAAAATLDRFSRGARRRPVVSGHGRVGTRLLRLAGRGARGHGPPRAGATRAAARGRR